MLFEYIAFFIVVFTSIVGIFAIVRGITQWIFNDNDRLQTITILPLDESEEMLEMVLRSFLENNSGKTLIVDMGLSEKNISIVKAEIEKRRNTEFIAKHELALHIGKII